jgi:thiol-disulfide isomerase/thioredoxin
MNNRTVGYNNLQSPNSGGAMAKIAGVFNSISSTTIIYIIALIIFIVISVYYYKYYIEPNVKPIYTANNEISQTIPTQQKTAELLFFYVDWCPHCKTAKPALNDLKAEYENKTINGYKIIFTDIDCTTETTEVSHLMDQYKIEGFPTIKLLKDGQVIEYDAKPSKETLEQFLKTVL